MCITGIVFPTVPCYLLVRLQRDICHDVVIVFQHGRKRGHLLGSSFDYLGVHTHCLVWTVWSLVRQSKIEGDTLSCAAKRHLNQTFRSRCEAWATGINQRRRPGPAGTCLRAIGDSDAETHALRSRSERASSSHSALYHRRHGK